MGLHGFVEILAKKLAGNIGMGVLINESGRIIFFV